MWRFLATLTLSAACYLRNGSFVADPAVGELCIECKLLGYVLMNGSCSTEVTYQPVNYEVTLTCNYGDCRVNGICMESKYGVICDECNRLGYLIGYQCECYPAIANKYQRCLHSQTVSQETLVVTQEKYYKWECNPFRDHQRGCFKLGIAPDPYRYGTSEFPPVPNRCCSDIYGPDPAQLVVPASSREMCNSFGGPDPNDKANPTFFYPCHNHGTWNKDTYKCTCSEPNWQAGFIGLDIYGQPAYSCNRCKPGWGPLGGDQCGAIYAPSTKTGISEICAGNGEMDDGVCSCFQNSTHGYWQLSEFTFASQVTNGSGVVRTLNTTLQVCGKCIWPYEGQSCLDTPYCLRQGCPESYTVFNETFYWANNTFPRAIAVDAFTPCENDRIKNAMFVCSQTNCTHFYRTRQGMFEFLRDQPDINTTIVQRSGKIYKPC